MKMEKLFIFPLMKNENKKDFGVPPDVLSLSLSHSLPLFLSLSPPSLFLSLSFSLTLTYSRSALSLSLPLSPSPIGSGQLLESVTRRVDMQFDAPGPAPPGNTSLSFHPSLSHISTLSHSHLRVELGVILSFFPFISFFSLSLSLSSNLSGGF